MVVWGVWSLASLPPLNRPPQFAENLPLWLAVWGVLLYGGERCALRTVWRRHPSLMLLAVPSAFILLAESMIAIAFGRNWHLSWWEWHILLLAAFGLVAVSAQVSWREERFAELYLAADQCGNSRYQCAVCGPGGVHRFLRELIPQTRWCECSTSTSRLRYLRSLGHTEASGPHHW